MTNEKMSRLWAIVALVVAILGCLIAWRSLTTVRGAAVEHLLPKLLRSLKGDERTFAAALRFSYDEFRDNAQRWSLVHYGSTILAAMLSAGAGVVLKLELWLKNESLKKDLAAAFAATAALVITISATVGFERKWQANRLAAAEVEAIALEFVTLDHGSRKRSLGRLGNALRRASLARQKEVVGADEDRDAEPQKPAGEPKKSPTPPTEPDAAVERQ